MNVIIKKLIPIFLLLFIPSIVTFSQLKKKEDKYLRLADTAYSGNKYIEAIEYYEKAYKKSEGINKKSYSLFKIGKSYFNIGNYIKANDYFGRAERAHYQKIDSEIYLYLAKTNMILNNTKEAKTYYSSYLEKNPKSIEAKEYLNSFDNIEKIKNNPERIKIQKIEELSTNQIDMSFTSINRKNTEFIFVSNRDEANSNLDDKIKGGKFTDLFLAKIDANGNIIEPIPLSKEINTESHEGPAVTNSKGTELYFTRCEYKEDGDVGCDILMATGGGKDWKNDKSLNLKEKTEQSVGHPALTPDDQVMVFAGRLPGGFGGTDLYMTKYDKRTKTWSKPQNLGTNINSAGDEQFPTIDKNGNLYFASNGRIGLGGFDIYKSVMKTNETWDKAEGLKAPINSNSDEFGIIFTDDKMTEGYFTSNRESESNDDIYKFEPPKCELAISGIIVDKDTKNPMKDVEITLMGSDGSKEIIKTNAKGSFSFDAKGNQRYIKKDVNYKLKFEKENYFTELDERSTIGNYCSENFFHEVELQCMNCKELLLPEVQYEFAKADLIVNKEVNSEDSLNYLYDILIKNPTIRVELQSHTDCRGSDKLNDELSQRRAQTCVDYLVKKGIDRSRLEAKGMGKNKPRDYQGKVLTCDYINSFKDKDNILFEKLHQLNRRTSFSVIETEKR